jgi:hypothetical protein
MNIELRLVVRGEWHGDEKVLQYRKYIDKTIYAHASAYCVYPND